MSLEVRRPAITVQAIPDLEVWQPVRGWCMASETTEFAAAVHSLIRDSESGVIPVPQDNGLIHYYRKKA